MEPWTENNVTEHTKWCSSTQSYAVLEMWGGHWIGMVPIVPGNFFCSYICLHMEMSPHIIQKWQRGGYIRGQAKLPNKMQPNAWNVLFLSVNIWYTQLFKSLGSVIFLKEVSYMLTKAAFIWLKNTVKTVIFGNSITIQNSISILIYVKYPCDAKAEFPASLLQSSVSHDPSEITLTLIWCFRNISYYYQC